MREKGVSSIVVIVIVIVIAVVAIAAVLLMRGGGTGLPVYSGARKLGEKSYGGATFELYSFTGSGEDAYNWYESQMSGQGWTPTAASPYYNPGIGCKFEYTKGNEEAVIVISELAEYISAIDGFFGVTVPSGSKIIILARGPSVPTF